MMREVYVLLAGQTDNVGDTALRRRALRSVAGLGRLHVAVGAVGPSFEAGLDLPDDAVVYRRLAPWLRAATRASVRPRSSLYVLNAGEVTCSRGDGLWHAALVPALLLGRLTGNPGVRTGIGARDKTAPWRLPIEIAARLCALNVWRDQWSQELFGFGDIAPDWAFDERIDLGPQTPDGPRDLATFTYRGDRPALTPDAQEGVRRVLEKRGLTPVVVAQVVRDEAAGRELAQALGAEFVGWTGADHLAQERVVRAVYRRSALVASNRIHALILGATEGAVPVGLMAHPDNKVGRTLAAAGFVGFSTSVVGEAADAADTVANFVAGCLDRTDEARHETAAAARRVREMEARVREVAAA